MSGRNRARRLDYSTREVRTSEQECAAPPQAWSVGPLVDGAGADSCPSAWQVWTRDDAPSPEKPAVVVIDYASPVRVSALAHYFHVPNSRDQRHQDYQCGPAAFREARVYVSDDCSRWEEAAHLTDLPVGCPQILRIPSPRPARYLKLEIASLADGAPGIRSYELDTYLDQQLDEVVPDPGIPAARGFAVEYAPDTRTELRGPAVNVRDGGTVIETGVPTASAEPARCRLRARVGGADVVWEQPEMDTQGLAGSTSEGRLRARIVTTRAGLLLEFEWDGPTQPPFRRLDVLAAMDGETQEWCVPAYHYSREKPAAVSIASAVVPTRIAVVANYERSLTIVPDTDRSWVGVEEDSVVAGLPLTGEAVRVQLVPAAGGWFAGFRRAVTDVFGFEEPRQFSPVSKAIPEICRYLLQPALWSEKYQMMRSFPDTDFFYIFYSLPYAVPALTIWEKMSGDAAAGDRIDCILRFTLERRLREGPMAGALFSEYADRELCEKNAVPFGYSPFYQWFAEYPGEQLVGMDQGCSRWITAHNMGAVLWTITYVWHSHGSLRPDILAGAREVADWMVRLQKDDGSWAYAYKPDGEVASPMSDSGTIWNVWSLYRFGVLTGESGYLQAAERAADYFRSTFTANHLYRGYWEDIYGGGKTELNTAQGYESAIAAIAFAEMGDNASAVSSARDALRFVCTRTLESRDYWTSYGGVAEQQNWAPGTYIAPTFGYAAHTAWRRTGDDFLRRFSSLARTIGWWQDARGGAFWLAAAISQQPIEMFREEGGGRQFWALWDSAQKVAFSMPWLVDEVNRRSGDRMQLDPVSLRGTDDRGSEVTVSVFEGEVESTSGQVNWVGLRSDDGADYQLVLMNHAENTDCFIENPFDAAPESARAFDDEANPGPALFEAGPERIAVHLPERCTVVLSWPGCRPGDSGRI